MPPYFSVKEAVFPFVKFPGVDTILGPEMKSTGEVMGVGKTFGEAFVKSQIGAGTNRCRSRARCSSSVKNNDKPRAVRGRARPGEDGLRAGRDQGHGGGDQRRRHRLCGRSTR